MTTTFTSETLHGQTVKDINGAKIGKIEAVYADDATNAPSWVAVSSGLFGKRHSILPLAAATYDADNDVRVAFEKDKLTDAPHFDSENNLTRADEDKLYAYYGVTGRPQSATAASTTPATDGDLIRSEERLRVGTENVEAGKARLRKYIVTQDVATTIPVSHEEVRVEREPIAAGETAGEPIGEAATEVTLHAERPVVAKETVPVERVRLATETVTNETEVNETLRKEEIDSEGVYPDADRATSRTSTDAR